MSEFILETKELTKNFGGLCAVGGVDFLVRSGEVVALIGPNGAGKTTFFNLLSGVLPPSSGRIYFKGRDISGLPPHRRCRLGLSRTFQKTSLFPELSVFENLRLGAEVGYGRRNAFWRKADRDPRVQEVVEGLLALVEFQDKAQELTGNLSHGDQRLLEVLMGLATRPDLLLLDEPSAGLSPAETRQLTQQVKRLSQESIKTVIIVEHDMEVVAELASRICVLHQGRILCTGSLQEVKSDPRVQEVYLGRTA